jgi:hypothetical protein
MIAKEALLSLKMKILPAGAEPILDFLASRNHQVELTQIVLENVPLLIIGRHGMIARIPTGGSLQKVSQPSEILDQLKTFFTKHETTIYLFTNLPDLPVPSEVKDVLEEVQTRHARREELQKLIDEALEKRDRASFFEASSALKELLAEHDEANLHRRRISF